jgi:hypothetical protein
MGGRADPLRVRSGDTDTDPAIGKSPASSSKSAPSLQDAGNQSVQRRARTDNSADASANALAAGKTDAAPVPLTDPGNDPAPGQHNGQQVGKWGTRDPVPLMVGTRVMRDFGSYEEASAYARGIGCASALFEEDGFFVVYLITNAPGFDFSSTRIQYGLNISNVRATPGVLALITVDGIPITPNYKRTSEGYEPNYDVYLTQTDRLGEQTDPFQGHIEAFGLGLDGITNKEKFLRQFELAMRDTALVMLDHSQNEANAKEHEMRKGISAADKNVVQRVAEDLARIDREISTHQWELRAVNAGGDPKDTAENRAIQRRQQHDLQNKIDELQVERRKAVLEYPILSQVDPADFLKLNDADRATALGDAALQVLVDIETTRTNILGGNLNLWLLAPLVRATKQGLGIAGGDPEAWINEKSSAEQTWDVGLKIALGVLQFGFAIAATAIGGPVGAAFAVGALGLGVADAIIATDDYVTKRPASNTDINRDESLVTDDISGDLKWVVVAWVGVGLSFAEAVKAVRLVKAGASADAVIARMAKQTGLDEDVLRQAFAKSALGKARPDEFALQQILRSGMTDEVFAQLSDTPVVVLSDAEFSKMFGDTTAEAATVFNRAGSSELRATVYFRETGNPLQLREEALHLEQALDPEAAKRIEAMREVTTAKWSSMKLDAKLKVYRGKIELEIDAQMSLLNQGGDAEYAEDIQESLKSLRARLQETDDLLQDSKRLKQGPAPEWLTQDTATTLFAKPRLPRTNGTWISGRPGNGLWKSDNPLVNAITNNEPIPFRNNRPVFAKWSKARVTIGEMSGAWDDFAEADYQLAKRNGWLKPNGEPNMSKAAEFRAGANTLGPNGEGIKLTWHHHQGGRTMMLIPTDLHANVPHTGGAAAARAGNL